MNRLPRISLVLALGSCTPGVNGASTSTGAGGHAATSTGASPSSSATTSTSTGTGGCVDSARIDQSSVQLGIEAWPDQHALAVAGDVDTIKKVDTCKMTLLPPTASLGAGVTLRGISRVGSTVVVGKYTPTATSVGFFDAATLSLQGESPINAGGVLMDGAGDGSALWLTFAPTNGGGILYRATTQGAPACLFGVGLSGGGTGRGLAFYNGQPVVGVHGMTARVATLPGCNPQTCSCGTPILSSPFPSGFDPWAIAVNGSKAYVVGINSLTMNSGSGGLFRVDLPSGVVEASLTWDPTPGTTQALDGFSSVTVVGSSLVVGGGKGVSFTGGSGPGDPIVFQSGSAVLLTYPLDFGGNTPPTHTATVAPGILWSLATDGTSVYAAGNGMGGQTGFIAKCTADLKCAP